MRINAIKTQHSFKGLFVDKSKENNGNWRMEYYPYSWELGYAYQSYDVKKTRMDDKKRVDINASTLPDNEEIFEPMSGSNPEVSKDLLGTRSYYRYPGNVNNGEMRRQITVMPGLSREESLKVLLEKYGKFKELKEKALDGYSEQLSAGVNPERSSQTYSSFRYASRMYDDSNFGYNKYKEKMSEHGEKIYGYLQDLESRVVDFCKMRNSIKAVDKTREDIKKELEKIETAKKKGTFIDISRRDVSDPNKPLWDIAEAISKGKESLSIERLVALPHKCMSLQKLLEMAIQQYGYYGRDYVVRNLLSSSLMSVIDSVIGHRL